MIEEYKKKAEAEIKKIEAETKEIERKWYKKPENILKFLSFLVGAAILTLFSILFNINNARLKLERAELKRDNFLNEQKNDSIKNQNVLLSNLSDSLKINIFKLSDSLITQKNYQKHLINKISKQESRIVFINNELNNMKNNPNSLNLKEELTNLIKVEADAGPDQNICINERITLKATGGDSYLWSTGETTASITVSPTETTTYAVTVSEDNSIDIDDVTVFVDQDCTGNNSRSIINEFKLYPNPSHGLINIELTGFGKELNLSIFDLNGRLVYSENINNASNKLLKREIDFSKFGKGVYLVRTTSENKTETKKILVI